MKMPEFIPFHFDKFGQNLFRKHGAVGVGRWLLVKKAVAETPTLTINLNDISDRETLELDSGCSESELTELLDYAAQRGMIDAQLYGNGILWIENLDTDLGRFFKAGKRHLPKRPQLLGKIPVSSGDFSEKFQEVEQDVPNISEKFLEVGEKVGIPTHETKRNETNERNEHSFERENFPKVSQEAVDHPKATADAKALNQKSTLDFPTCEGHGVTVPLAEYPKQGGDMSPPFIHPSLVLNIPVGQRIDLWWKLYGVKQSEIKVESEMIQAGIADAETFAAIYLHTFLYVATTEKSFRVPPLKYWKEKTYKDDIVDRRKKKAEGNTPQLGGHEGPSMINNPLLWGR